MEYKTIRSVLLASALAASSGCSALGYRLVSHGPDGGITLESIKKEVAPSIDSEKARQYLQDLGALKTRKFEITSEKYAQTFRELQSKYGSTSDEPRTETPTEPKKPLKEYLKEFAHEDLRNFVLKPVRTPQNDSWGKRYVLDLPNGVFKVVDLTLGQVRRLRSSDHSRISEAYERHTPTSIRAGLAAGVWYQTLNEADRLAVDQNWQSPDHSFFGNKDNGPRITPPSPTSNPPLGVSGSAPNPQDPNNPGPFFGGGSAD